MTAHKQIILVTGERQIGKSMLCQALIDALRCEKVGVSGLVTRHTGPHDLSVFELQTGQTYALTLPFLADANRSDHEEKASGRPRRFQMNAQAFARSTRALEASFPTQVFVIDEIGPLELVRRQGWIRAIPLLQTAVYNVAIVVIRPELLYTLMVELGAALYTVVCVTLQNRDDLVRPLCDQVLALLNGPDVPRSSPEAMI